MGGGTVSTGWLAAELGAPDLRVVDATWRLPTAGGDPRDENRERRIPGAVYFDIDEIADPDTDLPHMLPDAARFADRAGALGIGDGDRIVVYDAIGLYSAPRVWWMFRCFGISAVAVLDGGLPKWLAEGREVESGLREPPLRRTLTARFDPALVRDADQVARAAGGSEQVLDARAAERFEGRVPEPRAGLRRGHIPGSGNLPYDRLLRPDQTLRPAGEIRAAFDAAGVDLERPIVTTCGSGITAAILTLGLHLVGHSANAMYDGSWSEWGADPDRPVEA